MITIVTSEGVNFREESLVDIGKEGHYKLVPANAEEDDFDEFIMDLRPTIDYYLDYDARNRRGTLAPFSPGNIAVTSNGLLGWAEGTLDGIDIDIDIERRTRAIKEPLLSPDTTEEPNPLLEEKEEYEVKIYYTTQSSPSINSNNYFTLYNDPDSTTPNRVTISSTLQPTYWSSGGGRGPIMRVEVWQISQYVGKGSIASFEVSSDGTVDIA